MTRRMLRQNLVSTLVPMLLSVLALGILSMFLIFRYSENDLRRSNMNLLSSMQYNIELIMRDLDGYSYSFSSNPTIIARTKEVLGADSYSYSVQQSALFISNTIDTPVNTNPYLHSAYVYFYGYDKLLSSGEGLVNLVGFYDEQWIAALKEPLQSDVWFQRRQIQRYSFEKQPTEILTLYRLLSSPGMPYGDGVVTINLDAAYVGGMLQGLVGHEGQLLVVADAAGTVVLANEDLHTGGIEAWLAGDGGQNRAVLGGESYRVFQVQSQQYGLRFISLVPAAASYDLARMLVVLTILVAAAVSCIGTLIAVATTRRSRKQLEDIIGIFSRYEETGEYPQPQNRVPDGNVYDYIVHNVVSMFLHSNQMKMQLTERKYAADLYELKALQAQINPHFLFNVLETINWQSIDVSGGYTIVNEMLENLSRILKYCLSNAEEKVPLRSEIEYTRHYMAIQNVRYNDQFKVIWEYDEEDGGLEVMKLLFQPLVENSMKHGGLSRTRSVNIKIRIKRRGGRLYFSIIDNGVGMDKERLAEVRESLASTWQDSTHIGLVNTNQRLRLLYSAEYSIKIYSRAGLGTALHFSIPTQGTPMDGAKGETE